MADALVQVADGTWTCWLGQAPPEMKPFNSVQDIKRHMRSLKGYQPKSLHSAPAAAFCNDNPAQRMQSRYVAVQLVRA